MIRRFALVAAALAPATSASAALVESLSLPEMAAAADVVAKGSVVNVESAWSGRDRGGRILTKTTIRVDELWAAKTGSRATIVVVSPGGTVGDVSQPVPGASTFGIGEEVVVFARMSPAGGMTAVGLAAGTYHVVDRGGVKWAVRDVTGLGFVGGSARAPNALPLHELAARLGATEVSQ